MAAYDEFQTELDRLAEEEKRALLKSLRGQKPVAQLGTWLIGGPDAGTGWANAEGRREMEGISGRRQDVSRREQEALNSIINNPSPSAQDLMRHPATRSTGMGLLQETIKKKQTKDLMDSIRQQYMGGALPSSAGGGVPPMQMIDAMMQSGDPTLTKQAEMLYKRYYEGHDPSKTGRIGASGEMYPAPGAMGVLQDTERAQATGKAFATMAPTEFDSAGTQRPPQSVAGALGLGTPGGAGAGTPVPTPPRSSPTQPQNVVPGGGSGPAPTLGPRPSGQSDEQMNQSLVQSLMLAAAKDDGATVNQIAQTLQQRGASAEQVQNWVRNGVNMKMQQPQGQPQGPGPGPQQASAPGGYNPRALDVAKSTQLKRGEQVVTGEQALKDYQEAINVIQELKKISPKASSGMYGYEPVQTGMRVLQQVFGEDKGTQDQLENSRKFQALFADLRAAAIKNSGFGTGQGFTQKDLEQVLQGLPQLSFNKGERGVMLDQIEKLFRSRMEETTRFIMQQGSGGLAPRPTNPTGNAPVGKQSALPDSYWSANATAGGTVLPRSAGKQPQPEVAWNPASEAASSLLSSGKGVLEGALDAWKNVGSGIAQVLPDAVLSPQQRILAQTWEAEKARQGQRGQEQTGYDAGKLWGGVFNPTMAIGGSTIPRAIGAGAASGFIQPASSMLERVGNTVASGGMGGGGATLGKALPTTKITGPAGDEAERLLKEFGVKPTSSQSNPEDLMSAVTRGLGVERAAAPQQIAAITQRLLKETGSDAKVITEKVLTDQTDTLAANYNKVFNKGTGAAVQSRDAKKLLDSIKNVPDVQDVLAKGGAPSLAKVVGAIEKAQNTGTWVKKVPMDTMHQAWKEIGQVAGHRSRAAGEIRSTLESVIERGLPTKDINEFRKLNQQWGALEDIKRVWEGGTGQGSGPTRGMLKPSSLEQWGGRHPNDQGIINEAGALVRGMGIHDYQPPGIAALAGVPLNLMDASAVNSSPWIKQLIESLRIGSQTAPREYAESRRQDAAQ